MSTQGHLVGVLGGGTMGLGVAQVAALSGDHVRLFEPDPRALAGLLQRLERELERGVKLNRWTTEQSRTAVSAIRATDVLADLDQCQLVVECVPESLDLKRQALRDIEQLLDPSAVLASNTSSLLIAGLASVLQCSERFLGMHFFNPPALMPLVEIVVSPGTSADALAAAQAAAGRWNKAHVSASDTPGFIVNRCARPFYGEADRIISEGIADRLTVDELVRAAGFRLGPFELADMIGLDVNLDIQRSLWEQSFGEPRWRPVGHQAALVTAGRLGRKSGAGYYDYPRSDRSSGHVGLVSSSNGILPVEVHGTSRHARELRAIFEPCHASEAAYAPKLHIECGPQTPVLRSPQLVLCWRASIACLGFPRAIGFSYVPPLTESSVIELACGVHSTSDDVERARATFGAAGLETVIVGDGPGLVSARIVAQLINEAWFALQEGIASRTDIDLALRLGLSYPHGPFEWAEAIGQEAVLGLLDGLYDECHDDRYRAAPLLRRNVAQGIASAWRQREGLKPR